MLKQVIIQQAISALMRAVPPEVLADGADYILDAVERVIEQSESRVDDALVLPLIKVIRTAFNLPDNDLSPAGKG